LALEYMYFMKQAISGYWCLDKNERQHYLLFRKTFALYFNATVLSSSPMATH